MYHEMSCDRQEGANLTHVDQISVNKVINLLPTMENLKPYLIQDSVFKMVGFTKLSWLRARAGQVLSDYSQ